MYIYFLISCFDSSVSVRGGVPAGAEATTGVMVGGGGMLQRYELTPTTTPRARICAVQGCTSPPSIIFWGRRHAKYIDYKSIFHNKDGSSQPNQTRIYHETRTPTTDHTQAPSSSRMHARTHKRNHASTRSRNHAIKQARPKTANTWHTEQQKEGSSVAVAYCLL